MSFSAAAARAQREEAEAENTDLAVARRARGRATAEWRRLLAAQAEEMRERGPQHLLPTPEPVPE